MGVPTGVDGPLAPESLLNQLRRFRTASLTALPSAVLPASSAIAAFITLPKSFAEEAAG